MPETVSETGAGTGGVLACPSRAGGPRQIERRDSTDIVAPGRERVQSMRGFDDEYADIVDYIVRCTHRIWDERDVGLIYTHYTHNCTLYDSLGALYSREEVVRDTLARLVSLPERRGMATQVVWRGDDETGFYTSHLVTGSGRHTQHGFYGPPTGRTFVSRTVADCMIYENRIYREWVVADTMAVLRQLGIDVDAHADKLARERFAKGLVALDLGENRRALGQYPPDAGPDLSIADTELERATLDWLHEVWNRRMFGRISEVYAPTVQYHGPLMAELYGIAAVMQHTLALVGSLPDALFLAHHVCSTPCDEGGTKVAVRWTLEGHHLGHGLLHSLGEPTGEYVRLMGMSHFHYRDDGRIVDEWRLYDELSALVQVKLARLGDVPEAQALPGGNGP